MLYLLCLLSHGLHHTATVHTHRTHSSPTTTAVLAQSRRRLVRLSLDEPDDADVKYFADLEYAKEVEPANDGDLVLPLFPLGAGYLPYTSPVLNIFEPRYRAMYNDILFNGARRFMVTNVDPETGRLAECGVIFYLDDLKEVSEQTDDRVKYIGSHRVIERAQLLRVLNPAAAASRETYLKAEVRIMADTDAETDCSAEEEMLRGIFCEIVDAQAALGEEPRFTEAVKGGLTFARGTSEEDKGMWEVLGLWNQFHEQRTAVVAQRMQRDITDTFQAYVKDNPLRDGVVSPRGEVRLEDLPPELLVEIQAVQARYREELDALDADPKGTRTQLLIQTESHAERLKLFRYSLEREQRRLTARKTLKTLFQGGPSVDEGAQ